MNAEQALERLYRQRAGFDGWCDGVNGYRPGPIPVNVRYARPAWRDPDSPGGWFVLPPKFEYDDAERGFVRTQGKLAIVKRRSNGDWIVWPNVRPYPTAPAAFRAALEYLEGVDCDDR